MERSSFRPRLRVCLRWGSLREHLHIRFPLFHGRRIGAFFVLLLLSSFRYLLKVEEILRHPFDQSE